MEEKHGYGLAVFCAVWAVLLALSGASCAEPSSGDGSTQGDDLWQVTLLFRGGEMSVVKVSEIPPLRKKVTSPGLVEAPVVVDYSVDWLDAQKTVTASGQVQMPVGKRAPGAEGEACVTSIPEEGVIVLRIPGPPHGSLPAALHMKRLGERGSIAKTAILPAALEAAELGLPIGRIERKDVLLPPPGPFAVTKVEDTGPDSNRLVIVFLGDGYTASEMFGYPYDVAFLSGAFMALPPWEDCFNATNAYRIDVESNESGADLADGQFGTYRDTYFNSSFWTNGIDRLLGLDAEGELRAVQAADTFVGAGVWDYLIVVVNSDVYGGCGGSITVTSTNSDGGFVVIHELGHSFAGLADEYTDAYPGFPAGDPEPNVDFDCTFDELKWNVWIEPGTPLPTPNDFTYYKKVGAFEGARYLTTGIYRPYLECRMRNGVYDFCPVCMEAHILTFFDKVNLTDSLLPTPSSTLVVPAQGVTASADIVPISFVTCEWKLDGVTLEGKTEPTLTLLPADIPTVSPNHTLELVVSCATALVRKTVISETYTWTLDNLSTSPSGDVNLDGEVDALDVQTVINAALSLTTGYDCDLNADGEVDAVDVQLVINAALGL